MKYYMGIDSSTSCTGIAVIDENNKLVFYDYCYTKDMVKKAQSLGEEFDIIAKEYEVLINRFINQTEIGTPYELYAAIEANSFGGYNTTMLLGITIGLMHSMLRGHKSYKGIKYSAVGNGRTKILNINQEIDLTSINNRNKLKNFIANWAEQTYNIKLPEFEKSRDWIKFDNTIDKRINDISDAIGLAYCCKNNLLSDRRELKIQVKKDDNFIRSLKNSFAMYRRKVEEWFKRGKQTKDNKDLKTLNEHIKTVETYYQKLTERKSNNSLHDKWITKKLPELKNKIKEGNKNE